MPKPAICPDCGKFFVMLTAQQIVARIVQLLSETKSVNGDPVGAWTAFQIRKKIEAEFNTHLTTRHIHFLAEKYGYNKLSRIGEDRPAPDIEKVRATVLADKACFERSGRYLYPSRDDMAKAAGVTQHIFVKLARIRAIDLDYRRSKMGGKRIPTPAPPELD